MSSVGRDLVVGFLADVVGARLRGAEAELLALRAKVQLLEDFRRAYDAWAKADEHTAAKLFDEMLESREALRAADERERCQPKRRCTRHSPRCPRCVGGER